MSWTLSQFIRNTRKWCDDCAKWKFINEKVAQQQADWLKRRTKGGLTLYVYRCSMGGGYHLTHKKQK